MEHLPANPISDLLPSREFGMCFFFLLSGFVMEHAYGPRLKAGLPPWKMINIRIIRLYPLYLFAFLMGASVTAYGMWKGWDSTPWENAAVIGAFGLLMLPAPPAVSLALYPYLKPAWSIAFEMLASVIYAVTARFLTNRVLLVIVIGSGVSFASTTFLPARAWGWPGLWYGLSMVIYGFFGGVMIHRLYLAGKLPRWPAWLGASACLRPWPCQPMMSRKRLIMLSAGSCLLPYFWSALQGLRFGVCLRAFALFWARCPTAFMSRTCRSGGYLSWSSPNIIWNTCQAGYS